MFEALLQWKNLKENYESLQIPVHIIEGQPLCPDMVFAANQTLPLLDKNGKKICILSKMWSARREAEVPFFREWFKHKGYQIFEYETNTCFEGMGDAIWHPGKMLLWGGYGKRTRKENKRF